MEQLTVFRLLVKQRWKWEPENEWDSIALHSANLHKSQFKYKQFNYCQCNETRRQNSKVIYLKNATCDNYAEQAKRNEVLSSANNLNHSCGWHLFNSSKLLMLPFFWSKCVCGAIVVFHTDSDWGDAYSGKLIWLEFSWRLYSPAIFPTATFSSWHFIVTNSDVMAHVYRLNCEYHNIWHHINMHPFFSKRVLFLEQKTKI